MAGGTPQLPCWPMLVYAQRQMTDLEANWDEERAQRHLEWPRLAQAVMARCQCEATRRRGLPIEQAFMSAQAALTETAEVMQLLVAGEVLPLYGLRDLDAHLTRLSRAGVLDGLALADIASTLQAARGARRFVRSRKERAPALDAMCALDPKLDDLEDVLSAAIETDGTLFDHASPDLRKLRAEVSNLRSRIVARLQGLIDKHRDLLSDNYYTLREDRYVIPVRSDAHERFEGIVHATSDSGASLFVEPAAIVQQGNRLKMAQGELEREELRILTALCEHVREQLPALQAAVETLCRFDLRLASAKFGMEIHATLPTLHTEGRLHLRKARHPLLALDGVDVIDNDLKLDAGHGLIISGPNAGGKTVFIKTVGLFALMARAGLPLPCAADSSIGFFDRVLTDLGDEQSTQKNLSTFSAHVSSLARILDAADAGSLVLLDELCGGTDPQEGAALACAIAERLVQRKATLLVSTHYEQLKGFALRIPHLRSASVGFDLTTMEPSFRLHMDVPGASSALHVAGRFGISTSIIERARSIVPEHEKDFEALVTALHATNAALQAEKQELEQERLRAERLRVDFEQRLARLKERSQRKLTEEAEVVLSELQQARGELRDARKQLKTQELSRDKLSSISQHINEVAKRLSVEGDLGGAAAPTQTPVATTHELPSLVPGIRVHVPHLRSDATILEIASEGRIRVSAGSLKLWLNQSDLRPIAGTDTNSPVRPSLDSRPIQGPTADNTISVRGLRVDDALPMMESFIDRLRMGPLRHGYVDHGHGSGALRKAVREHLKQVVPHICEVRAGRKDEGGDALTAFTLEK